MHEELKRQISEAYKTPKNTLGWRFLYSPCSVLNGAKIAFIGLNPGGRNDQGCHPQFCMNTRSAYVQESWAEDPAGKSPLQKQVTQLFKHLKVAPESVLAGNLVPFRSPDQKNLRNKQSSVKFGEELWCKVLRQATPQLVVTMGKDSFKSISNILTVNRGGVRKHDINWQGRSIKTGMSKEGVKIVGLPHLSTYKIIGREKNARALADAFEGYWNP